MKRQFVIYDNKLNTNDTVEYIVEASAVGEKTSQIGTYDQRGDLPNIEKHPKASFGKAFGRTFDFRLQLHCKNKTPVLGKAISALCVKPKRGRYILWQFFEIDFST